jgi:hypothetical protein
MNRSAAWRSERVGSAAERRVPDSARPVRLRRHLEGPDERHRPSERNLDIGSAGQLQDGPCVLGDLDRVDIARHAGDGDDLSFGRGAGVEEREAVVDPGVDVEDERDRSVTDRW